MFQDTLASWTSRRGGAVRASEAPEVAVRLVGSLLALAIAAVHVSDQGGVTSLASPAWIGWGYRLIEVGAVLTALLLLVARPPWLGWAAVRTARRRALHRLHHLTHGGSARGFPGRRELGLLGRHRRPGRGGRAGRAEHRHAAGLAATLEGRRRGRRVAPGPAARWRSAARLRSGAGGKRVGRGLHLGEVLPPAGLVEGILIRAALPVDELPDDVCVAGVVGCLADHPDEQDAQGRIAPAGRPVRAPTPVRPGRGRLSRGRRERRRAGTGR